MNIGLCQSTTEQHCAGHQQCQSGATQKNWLTAQNMMKVKDSCLVKIAYILESSRDEWVVVGRSSLPGIAKSLMEIAEAKPVLIHRRKRLLSAFTAMRISLLAAGDELIEKNQQLLKTPKRFKKDL